MKYVLLFTILIVGCADKAAEKAAEKEVKQAEADSTVSRGEASTIDLGKDNLTIPEGVDTDATALAEIKAKLDCEKCGIKRDDKYESKTNLRYFVDCDTIKYTVIYDPEKKEVLESKLIETK